MSAKTDDTRLHTRNLHASNQNKLPSKEENKWSVPT